MISCSLTFEKTPKADTQYQKKTCDKIKKGEAMLIALPFQKGFQPFVLGRMALRNI
jgi:hypothetical protein